LLEERIELAGVSRPNVGAHHVDQFLARRYGGRARGVPAPGRRPAVGSTDTNRQRTPAPVRYR